MPKTLALRIALGFAAAKLLVHFLTNGQYGYFRDELYFLACAEHLDWGYTDHAPLAMWAAWFARNVFGESLFALRLLPALAGAAKVYLAGLIAVELGGGAWAAALACLCTLVAPVYLGIDTLLSMNAFEPVFWMGLVWVLIRIVHGGSPKLWLLAGLLAGLGLMNKHSTAFFLASLGAGLLITRRLSLLRGAWPWLGAALALLLFLPNLIWQAQHDFATLETLSHVRRIGKDVPLGPVGYLGQQIVIMLPATLPVWAAGLWFLLARPEGRPLRFLAWAYLLFVALMVVLNGKNYYAAPLYPLLFAAGGVFWEGLRRRRPSRLWWALPGLIAAAGVVFAPLALPVLRPERYVRYQNFLGVKPPKTEAAHAGPLPQIFGDMFGWPEMVEKVGRVYHSLPQQDRAKTAILAGNYGEAGAIDFFGRKYGLPKAISGHQSYYLWGHRGYKGEVVILLQYDRLDAEPYCASLEEAGRVSHPWAMREEHFDILVCRGAKSTLPEIWPKLKHWN